MTKSANTQTLDGGEPTAMVVDGGENVGCCRSRVRNLDRDDELDAPHPLLAFLNAGLFLERASSHRRAHYPCTL